MRLEDAVLFRKDLLFQGAVQLGWFERNRELSDKAAVHFIFHGPDYHGVDAKEFAEPGLQLIDTASFTREITERVSGKITDEPFVIAIAGYGTGKSHLAITLATLFSKPRSKIAKRIVNNLSLADAEIGSQVEKDISTLENQEYLVITLNGMEDFDLGSQISQQLLEIIRNRGLDTTVLEDLRRRFKLAENFTNSFHLSLEEDFRNYFGEDYQVDKIIQDLRAQDEDVFQKINEIYTRKMGSSFRAVGQESLQDFIRVAKDVYCGPKKPFAGIILFFDEFGRYLEFAVQKPHIAGPAALQQLYEAVQENGDRVFLVSFIQSELKAYVSRVAPERREEINRYVTRFDAVRKVRLSTNLETVITSLLEKKNTKAIAEFINAFDIPVEDVRSLMEGWFPEINCHALWLDPQRFYKIVCQGCWPLHPLSTWVLYKLTTIGKSLQQRSALSLLADVFATYRNLEFENGQNIRPAEILTEGLLEDFLISERYGSQRAVANAFQNVLQKYQFELSETEKMLLKSILLQTKVGIKVESKEDYIQALAMFSGIKTIETEKSVHSLEKEYGVLEWNGLLCQYEIIGDAVPRKTFLDMLDVRVERIDFETRRNFFNSNFKHWSDLKEYPTDFETEEICTKEWNYTVHYSDVSLLENQIEFALREWVDAKNVDMDKGQLIYCYIGPESQLELFMRKTKEMIAVQMNKLVLDWGKGAPLAIVFLCDSDGTFGQKLAEYWVLERGLDEKEKQKYANFIQDKLDSTWQEIQNQFAEMEKERNVICAAQEEIPSGRLKVTLEKLFDIVYPERIPFPFDGFATARGNAARDCQAFTKELVLGNLDRDWLQARSRNQQNRGYAVLDRSWGIFDKDGSVRLLPNNAKVRSVIKKLDSMLEANGTDTKSINLGQLFRLWCAPPFGFNLASAGLLLGLFIGRRRDELELYRQGEVVMVENWLSEAMPRNFFDLSILDKTEMARISKKRVSEWEALLDEWDLETTYVGMVQYLNKSRELEERVPVPQGLYYRIKMRQDDARRANLQLGDLEMMLNEALEKIEKGKEREDVAVLSWGAAILAEKYQSMKTRNRYWTPEQIREVERYYTEARLKTKQLFPNWVVKQKVNNIEKLSKFKFMMNEKIGANLRILGLDEERKQLRAQVEDVERHVRLIAEIKDSTSVVDKLVQQNIVSNATTVNELKVWLEQAEVFKKRLQIGWGRTDMVKDELTEAAKKLNQFETACNEKLQEHNLRAADIYNQRSITCLSDIIRWKTEVIELSRIFAGQEKDLEDFNQILRQLELYERQYRILSDESLSEDEVNSKLDRCQENLESLFVDDVPPLDSELFYESMMGNIRSKRKQSANEWLDQNLPKKGEIQRANPERVLKIKNNLVKMPPTLIAEQRAVVYSEIEECERRLDELEVEGLFVKFNALSERNKKVFLKRLADYFQSHIVIGNKQSKLF